MKFSDLKRLNPKEVWNDEESFRVCLKKGDKNEV